MGFTYEDKVIIKYLRQKYGFGHKRIVADHPEFGWNVHGVKTSDVKQTSACAMSNIPLFRKRCSARQYDVILP